jgi:hypothetical protein
MLKMLHWSSFGSKGEGPYGKKSTQFTARFSKKAIYNFPNRIPQGGTDVPHDTPI